MKATTQRSQYFLLFVLTGSGITLYAAPTTPTIAERFSSIETNLSVCRSKKSTPEETKAAATEALDTCGKLRQQVRDQLTVARTKREEAEQALHKAQTAQSTSQDWESRFKNLEAQLFETRRALEAKTSELQMMRERASQQHAGFTKAQSQFEQLRKENTALKVQLAQSAHGPATASPPVASHGAAAIPGTA